MKTKKELVTYLLIIIGIVVLVNLLLSGVSLRLDMTEDNRFTLSEATENIIEDLDAPVTITAYFSEELPPDVGKTKKRFKELLREYSKIADGKIVYEFKNPNANKEIEQEAQQAGIRRVLINVRKQDAMKQQKAYMGAVLKYRDNKETIPFMKRSVALEYTLSSNLKKLTVKNKPAIGLVQGHGEPGLRKLQQARKSLNVLYDLQTVRLSDTNTSLNRFKALAIIAPTDSFPQAELNRLNQYLENGNDLFIGLNRVDGDLQQARGKAVQTGLPAWLKDKGLIVENQFLIDKNCGAVTARQQHGRFSMPTRIQFPYFPILKNLNKDHAITKGLEMTVHKFASPLRFEGDTARLTFTPIARSSKFSGTQSCPTYFNVQKNWTESDFPQSHLPVAAAIEGTFGMNSQQAKMVLVGDGDFPVGQGNRRQQGRRGGNQVHEDNVNLLVNSIDWLADETGLVNLRTKGVTERPLKEIEADKKTFLKYLNFLLPILLIIIYGLIRMQRNNNLRIKRMEGHV